MAVEALRGDVVEVLVIGAGVSGAVVATRFAAAGLSVVCLEQGDWTDRADYPGSTPEWELRAARQWSSDPQVRGNRADYPLDLESSELGVLNFNGVGGGSVLYNAQWPRMLPDDFRVATVDGVADDWPISYADLQPYYEATDREFGVSGLGGNPAYPAGAEPPLPPLPIGELGLQVARAQTRLGWHWWPGTNAILSAGFDGRNPCVQRGSCGSGCNEGAKASTDVTHWPKALRLGARLVTGATVMRIPTDQRGLATGAEWIDRDGDAHFQPAEVVVCAANAIGTARLLLASAPDGLANSSGLVGRNLMLHPLASVSGLFEGLDGRGWRAHSGVLIHSLQFADSDPARGFHRGATWALTSAGGPLRAALAPDARGAWGERHHAHVRERLGRTATWVIIAEDLPGPENRVELSSTLVDAVGLAAPTITYHVSDNTTRLVDWHIARARESLEAAGAWHVDVLRHKANGHFMGTARMGTDPRASVVDPACVAHDVGNLLIVDGSVFVTAGSANPTSTIAALAARAADLLLARRREVPVPVHAAVAVPVGRQQRAPTVPVDQPTRTGLREPERARLARIADVLIPATDGMPGASEVGVAGALVDRVLRARPDLAAPLVAQLDSLPENSIDVRTDARFAALRYVVAAAYYLDDRVRDTIGYRPEPATPVHAREFPAYLEEGLLDHLVHV